MSLSLPMPLQRALAVALTLVTLAALWLGAARPLVDHVREQAQAIERERVLLGRFLAAGERSVSVGDLQRRIGQLIGSDALLDGESDAIRLASLQTLVGGLAEKSNVRLRSLRTLPRREQGRFVLLGVRLQATTDLAGAQALIHRLESAGTLLLISGAQLTRTSGGGSGGTGTGPAEIELRLDVLGLALKEAG